MSEKEKTQAVPEENSVPIPEKDLEEVAGGGYIIIDREPAPAIDPPEDTGG